MASKTQDKEASIAKFGKQITIPEGMSFDDAIEWIKRKKKEEETEVEVCEVIDGYPFDAAYAFTKALKEIYGWTQMVPTPGFFGPNPPAMIGVEVSPEETVQIPWGRIQVPKVEGFIDTQFHKKENRLVLALVGVVKQKHKGEIAEIAKLARKYLARESIYRGKAIRVSFPDKLDPTHAPKFMDLEGVNPDELVFSSMVEGQVVTNLFTPVERTEECRKYKIPLKRGVLLEGPYGTGKTLTANVTAKKCTENGWTFIYLKAIKDLEKAVYFAKQYQPAVIFAEDLDQVLSGNRDEQMNGILNVIDGIDTKSNEVIVVLTTNHVEKINKAMLRPGRLDAVVSVQPPDANAVAKLLRLYARGLIPDSESLAEVGKALDGRIPAVIREVVERSKLAAVGRLVKGAPLELTEGDLLVAARGMLNHLDLLDETPKTERAAVEMVAGIVGEHMAKGILTAVDKYKETTALPNGEEAKQLPART